MNKPLFLNGITGLSDTKWSGSRGNASKLVGIDFRSTPGIVKAQQKLKKISSTFVGLVETNVITDLCKNVVELSNGTKIWFSSETGKIWKQVSDTFSLLHTIVPLTDYVETGPTFSVVLGDTALPVFVNGITLNPESTILPELVASAVNQGVGAGTTISVNVVIPNEPNMVVVVFAGNYDASPQAASGVTFDGNAMTSQINGAATFGTLKLGHCCYYYKNPVAGTKTVTVTFAGSVASKFLYVLVYKNVDQTTPIQNSDTGFMDATNPVLIATKTNQLRVACFMSVDTTHTFTSLQGNIIGKLTEIASDRNANGRQSIVSRPFVIGDVKTLSAIEFSYTDEGQISNLANSYVFRKNGNIDKIYYTTENLLFAIDTTNIDSWATNIESVGGFINGDDTYHPIINKNLELFIGDKTVVAKVSIAGIFIAETRLNIKAPERIQELTGFDTDILIGTLDINKSRVLRWDCISDSWSAEDDIFEKGINAFIKDDNYTYVSAGEFGRLYFYNGAKLSLMKRIPGTYDSTHKIKINPRAVDFLNGTPVFGVSNLLNNPVDQGVYCYGGYDTKYPKSLSLDFPLPNQQFTGVEIGVVYVNGTDMWVAYKSATDVGVCRIDHTLKYEDAYIETMQLTSNRDRDTATLEEGVCIDYIALPSPTDVEIWKKTKYDASYTQVDTVVDTSLMSIKTKSNIPNINSLQLRFDLISVGNNSPEVENFGLI